MIACAAVLFLNVPAKSCSAAKVLRILISYSNVFVFNKNIQGIFFFPNKCQQI